MPIFLAFTLLFAAYLHYKIRQSNNNSTERESLIEVETKANFTRKKDLSALTYIRIDFDKLPLHYGESSKHISDNLSPETREEIISCEKKLLSLKDKKIVNFTGVTNTDLKLQYGVANLPFLMQYDENFSKFSRILSKWGKLLFNAGEFQAAKMVLEYAADCRCDIEDIFLTLGKIYIAEGNRSAITHLSDKLDCFDEIRRNIILKKLSEL